jgi:hypothetical protein
MGALWSWQPPSSLVCDWRDYLRRAIKYLRDPRLSTSLTMCSKCLSELEVEDRKKRAGNNKVNVQTK